MRTRLSVSEQKKAKLRRLAICNRIQLQNQPGPLESGSIPPVLDVNGDGLIDTVEVGKYVIKLLQALEVDVPAGLLTDDPEKIAEALLLLLEDIGPQPVTSEESPEAKQARAEGLQGISGVNQMRARRRGQRTQLSTGGKLSYGELLRKPHAQMTYGDRHRLALFKIGVNPDSKDGKYSAGKQS